MAETLCGANASLRSHEKLRAMRLALLMGTAAALPQMSLGQDACTLGSAILTCSGDQSGGILAESPIETLDVHDLTTGITPAASTVGILYETDTNATLLSDTGSYAIHARDADGIRVRTIAGDAYVRHTGDVTAEGGRGLHVFADNGAAVIEGAGDVSASLDAISARPRDGAAVLNWTGAITSTEGRGIYLRADQGSASASGAGIITAREDAVTLDSRGAGDSTSLTWSGDITSQAGNGVKVTSDNGGANVEGDGVVRAAGNGIEVDARGAGGHASINWLGDITGTDGFGARVHAANGGADLQGAGRVVAGTFGLTAEAVGGTAEVIWEGDMTASGGTGLSASSTSHGATVRGSGTILASGTGLTAHTTSGGSAVVNWQGDVTSTTREGLLAWSASGGASAMGSGDITGATHGIWIETRGSQTAALNWSGDITGDSGVGLRVFSANGSASASGDGAVTGALDAIHLASESSGTVALNWSGDIRSTAGNGVHVTSAQGAVSSTTQGAIAADEGGIYAWNGTADGNRNVAVRHDGTLTAGGVGVEARSSAAAVSARVTGDMETGAQGIFAQSLGARTVAVEQTGTLRSGHTGIEAYSATGTVNVTQAGTLDSAGHGISAITEGGSSVFVGKTGDLAANWTGLSASSATGGVTVRMTGGDLSSGGDGIVAANEGAEMVVVEMTGDVTAGGDGVAASSSNGEVYASVIGAVRAGGTGVAATNTGSGEVGVTQTGDVIAGGDGLVAASATGNTTVSLTEGDVLAGANGLRLSGFGNLSANIAEGTSVTGGAGFAGVLMETGLNNTVTNYGRIANSGGIDDFAILAEGNDTLVENHGTISGNVSLGPWANGFNNHEDALLESGSLLSLGVGNTLRNEGTLSPGGTGRVMTTVLDGNLDMGSSSALLLDVDMSAGTTDVLQVSGTAAVRGEMTLRFATASATPASYNVVTTGAGLTAQDLMVTNDFVTSAVQTVNDGHDLQLTITGINLTPEGLTGPGSAFGRYLTRSLAAGGEGVDAFGAMILNNGSLEGAQQVYDEVAPAAYLDGFSAGYQHGLTFAESLMSCAVPAGLNAPVAEGSCQWTRFGFGTATRDAVGSGSASTDTFTFSHGAQKALGQGDWRIGGAIGMTQSATSGSSGDSSDATNFHAGLSLKYAPGPYVLAAALTGTRGMMDSTRYVDLGSEVQTLTGETHVNAYTLKLRGAYVIEQDGFYLKPQVDLDTTVLRSDSFTETGGTAALRVEGLDEVIYSLTPALEVGTNSYRANGSVLRSFARLGASFYSQEGVSLTSRLASDATGVEGFRVNGGGDTEIWSVGAGFTAFQAGGWSAEALVEWNVGDATDERQASIKLRTLF